MKVVAVALKADDLIFMMEKPARHHDVLNSLSDFMGERWHLFLFDQGFITSEGKFVGREEARKIADAAGQIIESVPGPDGVLFKREHRELFSEDVW